jgi:hypothetical protein
MTATVTDCDASVARATRIWVEMLPDAMGPDEGEFFRWLDKAGNDASTPFRAINRAAKKRKAEAKAGIEMSAQDLGRYISSTIRHETTGKHTAPENSKHADTGPRSRGVSMGTGWSSRRRVTRGSSLGTE